MMEITTKKGVCYAILAMDDRQLTPEAKYFLIRILYLYGDVLVTATVKELAKTVGLTDEAFAKARTLLCTLGYVEVAPVLDGSANKEKSGRPRLAFKIAPNFVSNMRLRFAEQSPGACRDNHPQLLGRLLFWSNGGDALRARNEKKAKRIDPAAPRKHTFTVATRILLATLYSHADPCGVVIHLGMSRLSKLTGMSVDRLESQLGIIKNLGYLIDKASGLTGKQLFGRAASAFHMNVSDDDCQSLGLFTLVAFETNAINYYNEHYWGFRLNMESRNNNGYVFNTDVFLSNPNALAGYLANWFKVSNLSIESPEIDWSKRLSDLLAATRKFLESNGLYGNNCKSIIDDPTAHFTGIVGQWVFDWSHLFLVYRLHEFFCDPPKWGFSNFLQYRIDYYSALILNVGLSQITVEKLVVYDAVLDRIASDLFPRPLESQDQENVRRSALALLIYCISYQQALMVKSLILKAEIVPGLLRDNQYGLSFAILPVREPIHEWARRMTVAIRGGQNGCSERFCAVRFIFRRGKPIKIEKFSQEHDPVKCREIFSEFGYDIVALQGMTK